MGPLLWNANKSLFCSDSPLRSATHHPISLPFVARGTGRIRLQGLPAADSCSSCKKITSTSGSAILLAATMLQGSDFPNTWTAVAMRMMALTSSADGLRRGGAGCGSWGGRPRGAATGPTAARLVGEERKRKKMTHGTCMLGRLMEWHGQSIQIVIGYIKSYEFIMAMAWSNKLGKVEMFAF